MKYPITPVPAPRQSRRDTWNPRPCVLEYRAFRDEVRLRRVSVTAYDYVIFHLPVPKSWSKKKRQAMLGQPHEQRPDIDNLWKALTDSIHTEDSHLWRFAAEKRWAEEGAIEVIDMGENFWSFMGQHMVGVVPHE